MAPKTEDNRTPAPTAPVPIKNLRQKIAHVRANLAFIEKRGKNKHHDYEYATAADVQGLVGKALAEAGVIIGMRDLVIEYETAKTRANNDENVAKISCIYSFLDTDSDEKLDYPAQGEGRDPGDKAVYKARTGAMKYFLSQALCLGLGDDPEETGDEEHERGSTREKSDTRGDAGSVAKRGPMTEEQVKIIEALLLEAQIEPNDEKMLAYFKVELLKDAPFEKVKQILEKKAKQVKEKAIAAAASAPPEQPNADANDKAAQDAHIAETAREPGQEG